MRIKSLQLQRHRVFQWYWLMVRLDAYANVPLHRFDGKLQATQCQEPESSTRIPSARLRGSTSQITAGEVAVVLLLQRCEVSKPSLLSISLRSILTLVRFAVRVVQPLDAPAYMLSTVCAVSFEVMSEGAGMSTRLSLERPCRILRSWWSSLVAISLCSQSCRSVLSRRSLAHVADREKKSVDDDGGRILSAWMLELGANPRQDGRTCTGISGR